MLLGFAKSTIAIRWSTWVASWLVCSWNSEYVAAISIVLVAILIFISIIFIIINIIGGDCVEAN